MQKKNIISAALIVASFASISVAGTKAQVVSLAPIPAPAASPFSGSAAVGYSSNYDFRGLIPRDAHNGGNMTPIRVDTRYALNEKTAIIAGAGYKALWNRDNDTAPHDFLNEFNFTGGVEHKCAPGLTSSLYYNFFHGGLPGFVARNIEGRAHSITQEFGAGMLYDFSEVGAKGLFASANANYSFAGVTGWWFNGTVGYKKDICDNVAAILSASWNGTAGYFNAAAHDNFAANGTQGINLRLDVPVSVAKHMTLVPFIGTYWAGNGALKSRHATNEREYKAFRNFTVMTGVNLVYSF